MQSSVNNTLQQTYFIDKHYFTSHFSQIQPREESLEANHVLSFEEMTFSASFPSGSASDLRSEGSEAIEFQRG